MHHRKRDNVIARGEGGGGTDRYRKACCHAVEVVGVVTHGHHLGNDGLAGPLWAKYLGELLEILRCCLTDGIDGIAEPAHAEIAQLLVEELNTKLAGEEGNVLDDG